MKMKQHMGRQQDEQDEYDPFAHRPGSTTTNFTALMHLFKSAIGAGILFLPYAFRKTGYVMAFVCSLIIAGLYMHTSILLVRYSQKLCRWKRVPMLNFAETARTSFEAGPEGFRKYAKVFAIITDVAICIVHYQGILIYILYVATSFQQVIEFFSSFKMDVRIYLVIFFPFSVALGFIPSLKYLMPFSVLGTLFLLIGILIALYYFISDIPEPARLDAFTKFLPVPLYCSMFLFALHNITLYLPLENTMLHPTHLPRLIITSIVFNTIFYLVFGFLGYNKYPHACDTVIKNLPLDDVLAQLVKITISLSVLFTIGLSYFVPINILWPLIKKRMTEQPKLYQRLAEISLRLGGMLVLTLIAIAIPQMVALLGLFSAFSVNTTMLLVPILIETSVRWRKATKMMLVKNSIIFLIYLIILVFSMVESIWLMIREFSGIEEECL